MTDLLVQDSDQKTCHPGPLPQPQLIDPNTVLESTDRPRQRKHDPSLIKRLAADIAARGQQNPVMVMRLSEDPDYSFVEVYGGSRIEACIVNHMPVLAYVLEENDPRSIEYAVAENQLRKDLGPAAFSKALLLGNDDYQSKKITTRSGQTLGYISVAARQAGRTKESIRGIFNSARALSKKMGGYQVFDEIGSTKLDRYAYISELASEWDAEEIREEIDLFKSLDAEGLEEYRFPTKRKPRESCATGQEDNCFGPYFRFAQTNLDETTYNLILLIRIWNEGGLDVQQRFFAYLKCAYDFGSAPDLNEDEVAREFYAGNTHAGRKESAIPLIADQTDGNVTPA